MTHFSPEDPKLTAYALGELQGQERAHVEAALRADPAARATVERIRAFASELTHALAAEAAVEPEAEWANAVAANAAAPDPAPAAVAPPREVPHQHRDRRRNLLRFPQLYFLIGGLAAAAFALVVLLRDEKPMIEAKHYEVIDLTKFGPSPVASGSPVAAPSVADDALPAPKPELPEVRTGTMPELTPARLAAIAARTAVPAVRTPGQSDSFLYQQENPFVAARTNGRSTFGLEVNAASYAEVQQFIASGRLPPRDDVRIDELLNAFTANDPAPPSGAAPLAARIEVAPAPWAPAHRLVRIGLRAQSAPVVSRDAANLVFLIDVSASMDAPNKLPLVKDAMRRLVERLRPDDRVAIVTYAGTSGIALRSTPAREARAIVAALDTLNAGGSTNGAMGIQTAYELAKANFVAGGINRVVLCTDGDFNVGSISQHDLAALVGENAKSGVELAVLGFGMTTRNDPTLEQLAASGGGRSGYVATRAEADALLGRQIDEAPQLVARDVRAVVTFDPAQVAEYRLIGYEDRVQHATPFDDTTARGVDLPAGYALTALYEVVPTAAAEKAGARANAAASADGSAPLVALTLRYRNPDGGDFQSVTADGADRPRAFGDASADFKFAAAVAEFGMILRDSPHRGNASLADVIAWAGAATKTAADDPHGYRREFIDLARRTQAILQ